MHLFSFHNLAVVYSHNSVSKRSIPPTFSAVPGGQALPLSQFKRYPVSNYKEKCEGDTFSIRFQGGTNNQTKSKPNELLTLQRQAYQYKDPKKTQAFLNVVELLINQKLDYGSTQNLRSKISQYSIPLLPDQEEYRGMILTQKQVQSLLSHLPEQQSKSDTGYHWTHAYPGLDDGLGKQLLHGFKTNDGSYSYHGVPSISLTAKDAASYAFKAYRAVHGKPSDISNSQVMSFEKFTQLNRSFVPVVVTIENDKQHPPKGFLWKKKSDKLQPVILLDLSNHYQVSEVKQRYGMLQIRIHASHPPATIEVPLIPHASNTFAVPVSLNRQAPKPILLDTGASWMVITEDTAKALGIEIKQDQPTVTVSTANGEVERPLVELEQVSVGGMEVPNLQTIVTPDSSQCGDILGMNFFKGIDFALKQGHLIMNRPG